MAQSQAEEFEFADVGILEDGDLILELIACRPADPQRGWAPSYEFEMRHLPERVAVGRIALRVGDTEQLRMYGGHIGYGVLSEHRGHRYAARSCRLLLPLARHHGLDPVWITCNPDNWASRRSCELAGARFIEIVRVPQTDDHYLMGEKWKCRYRLETGLLAEQGVGIR